MSILGQDRAIVWLQEEPFSVWSPYGVADKSFGMSGISVPAAGRTPLYVRDRNGQPVLGKMNQDPPGDLVAATLSFYERGQVDVMLKALQKGCPINVQRRLVDCGPLDVATVWTSIEHFGGGQPTAYNPSDGPALGYDGTELSTEVTLNFTHYIKLVDTSISLLTSGLSEDILAIAGMADEDCGLCGTGYPGADQIMYAGTVSPGTDTGALLYTGNGGGSWAEVNTDPWDSSTDDEDIGFVAVRTINKSQIRVIVGNTATIAGQKAKIAYADINLAALGTASWTSVTLDSTATGDFIQGGIWATFGRLYLAAAGDIYLSTNQGESVGATALYTGSNALTAFAISPDESTVWAGGASNTILREVDQSGVFETRTGPSGGGAFTALAVAGDGTLFAGNGQKIFRSSDAAGGTAGWTELKDFGSNKAVAEIQVIGGQRALGGDSQLLRVFIDDTAGSTGQLWQSVDGGTTWFQPDTEATNTGINAAYFSAIDDNLAIAVGDGGVIMRVAP